MSTPLQLIVGLGNPGEKYSETRHNAGFWFVDLLASGHGARFRTDGKFHGQVARINPEGTDCRLLKPSTFMNDSGRAVGAMLDYYSVPVDAMLVVHDEIDLPPGTVRLKFDGGHGGHNGLQDVIACVGSNFMRIRIGVGHPGVRDAVISYVLNRPGRQERSLIDGAMDRALKIMPLLFEGKDQLAMTELHTDSGE